MSTAKPTGTVCTFYSYKGGVGRSLALANIAMLLAQWGNRVLCVDWDLEAPGLHLYFQNRMNGGPQSGVVELVDQLSHGEMPSVSEHVCAIDLDGGSGQLDVMAAGRPDDGYVKRMQALDWARLYADSGLGTMLERLREQWKEHYDFVLLDSRTGISDVGGICTVQLPDLLAFCFTPNYQSLNGALEVVQRADTQRARLPFDRSRIPAMPVITRFEATIEVDLARKWMTIFQDRLAPTVAGWAHRDVVLAELLPHLRVPHVAHWSFGERLPVVEEGTTDPLGIGYAFETLAAVVANRLEATELLVSNRQSYVDAAMSRARSDGGAATRFDFDLFLTAPPGEAAFADKLALALMDLGVKVATDTGSVSAGGRWADAVTRGMARSRNMAFVVGDDPSAPLTWTEQEVRQFVLARAAGEAPRLLLPIVRGDPENIPRVAQDIVWVDARKAPPATVAAQLARSVFEQILNAKGLAGTDERATLAASVGLAGTLMERGELQRAHDLLADVLARSEGNDPLRLRALQSLATLQERTGRFDAAVPLWRELLTLLRAAHGLDPESLRIGVRLASALRAWGELDEAEDLLRQFTESARDSSDLETQWSIATELALVLADRERYGEAVELMEGVVEQRSGEAGDRDPATLTARGTYGRILARAGQFEDAVRVQGALVAAWRETPGADDREALHAQIDLANTIESGFGAERALETREAVAATCARVLGPDDVDTFTAEEALGRTMAGAGRLDKASELQERILKRAERILGSEHPLTLRALDDLGTTLLQKGMYERAVSLLQRAVEQARASFGEEDEQTLRPMSRLAIALFHIGHLEEARDLEERVLDAVAARSGDEDPATLMAMGNLAATLDALGDYERSLALAERVLAGSRKAYGEDHPKTLQAMHNLAATFANLGDLSAAEQLLREVLDRRTRSLGDRHPDTLGAMSNLAETLAREGRLDEALELLDAAYGGLMKALGPDHPTTLNGEARLGRILAQVGRGDEARKALEHAARGLASGLGERHPDTVDVLWNLQGVLVSDGAYDVAKRVLEQVVDARRALYGENHSATVVAMAALADTLERLGDEGAAKRLRRRIDAATRSSA